MRSERVIARRASGASCAANGLPSFSRSSSKASAGNIVAQPAGPPCACAKEIAEFLNRKSPPIRPFASRATQNPARLRPMKNAGIASLTTLGSKGPNCSAGVSS